MSWILLGLPIGLILLYFGSEWMVDGAKKMALRLGVAPFVVGLTVVAFGSSAPELITSLISAETPQIILGNVVGSNIANVGLGIALAAIIYPLVSNYTDSRFELLTMMGSVVLITALALSGVLTWIYGIVLVALLFAFVIFVYIKKKDMKTKDVVQVSEEELKNTPAWRNYILVIAGIIMLYLGAKSFIGGAIELAGIIGISEQMTGLLVVAIGTSLPELCISIIGAFRKENELVVSNIVGSIIFNCLICLGAGLLLTDIPITHYMMVYHLPVMVLMASLLFVASKFGNKVTRAQGVGILAIYMIYIGLMAVFPELTQGVM